ncbi:cytochrome C biogenesis protein CcdA [Mycolicibacterium chitae]|uniref:Cytochrome C biogenesis proteintrans membrane region n=1 Tax=Mycolicibacterium chitae TaxID=1792 RepID=A0A3S4RGX7_MYCCI|nr:cytochrome c biogenesis protein CcdA [Mycolicibacterium chitae]MCV7109156.1 cytochrome c biogenesis protein CcdA [Mycolicibacterium chitae]BBZ04384.1 cytochrome C biogenesis protein CcdA [Mycolicibacterium chitae]VEG48020.1 cytochrome C biogenesis proteintrans membrane region [Mycolicibacterium chitae]
MDLELAGLALAAGLVAALNPCGFAMLPAYLTFVVAAPGTRRGAAVGRAVLATAAMTAGFLTVFAAFGALTVTLASTVQRYLPVATVVIGALLLVLGVWLLSGRELRFGLPAGLAERTQRAPTVRLLSMFGYGLGFAVASLSCTIGPFLAVTAAGARASSGASSSAALSSVAWGTAALVYLSYAVGFALVVGTLAVAAAFASSALADRLRRVLPAINRVGGAVVALVGLYVAHYGIYELRLFHGGGDPSDPVIAAAGRIQGTLAGWVHRTGAWPWVLALLVLVVAALCWRRFRARPGPTAPRSAVDTF